LKNLFAINADVRYTRIHKLSGNRAIPADNDYRTGVTGKRNSSVAVRRLTMMTVIAEN